MCEDLMVFIRTESVTALSSLNREGKSEMTSCAEACEHQFQVVYAFSKRKHTVLHSLTSGSQPKPSTPTRIVYMRDMGNPLCRAIPKCTSMGLHSFEGGQFRPWIRTLVQHQTSQQQVHNPLPGILVPPCLYLLPRCICYPSSPKDVGSLLKCPPRYTTPVPPLYRFVPPVMRRKGRGISTLSTCKFFLKGIFTHAEQHRHRPFYGLTLGKMDTLHSTFNAFFDKWSGHY